MESILQRSSSSNNNDNSSPLVAMSVDRAVSPDTSVVVVETTASVSYNDKKQQQQQRQQLLLQGLRDTDITCSKNKALNQQHPGNLAFRQRIFQAAPLYATAKDRSVKMKLVQALVAPHQGSRFVKFDVETGQWVEASDAVKREKVGHALRFAIRRLALTGTHKTSKALLKEEAAAQQQQPQQQKQQPQQQKPQPMAVDVETPAQKPQHPQPATTTPKSHQQQQQEERRASALVSPLQMPVLVPNNLFEPSSATATPAKPQAPPLVSANEGEADKNDKEESKEPPQPSSSSLHASSPSEVTAFELFYCLQRKLVKQPAHLVVLPEIEHQLGLIIQERWHALDVKARRHFEQKAKLLTKAMTAAAEAETQAQQAQAA